MSGVAYHAWTHRPKALGGTDPIEPVTPFFRAIYQDDTGVTGITTTLKNLDWTWWQNQDTDVFQPLKAGGGAPINGTDLARYIRLKPPGLYSFSVACKPTSTTNMNGWAVFLSDDDTPWGFKEGIFHGPAISTYEHGGWMIFHWERIYPYIDPFDSEFAGEIVYYPPDMAGADRSRCTSTSQPRCRAARRR